MAKLGYVSDFSELSAFKAECFLTIELEIEETRAKEAERRAKKNGRRK